MQMQQRQLLELYLQSMVNTLDMVAVLVLLIALVVLI